MSRKPFTITMDRELLKKVDSVVDGSRIRNRSHALEYIVSLHFKPKIKKALILAGGEGVKMRPLTYEMPKTMLPVKGRPILEHILDLLRNHEIREIYIVIGHLGEKIQEYFGDGQKFGVKINYIEEKESMGTGGALNLAKKYLEKENFLMMWSDLLIDIDLDDFIAYHLEEKPILTAALTSVSDPSGYGAVKLHRNTIVEFHEKPSKKNIPSYLVSAGVFVVDPRIFEYLNKSSSFDLEDKVFPELIKQNQVKGYIFEGQWFDVGTYDIYQRAIKDWSS